MQGVVITIKLDKGYGFIEPQGGGENYFFHARDLIDLPFDGQLLRREVMFRGGVDFHTKKTRAFDIEPMRR